MDCSIAGCPFKTASPLGMASHARKHRNEFAERVGRRPTDYEEVREFFNGDLDITTLDDYNREVSEYGR